MAKKKIESDKKACIQCKTSKVASFNYYSTSSSMFPDGRAPICKTCIKDNLDVTDIASVKKVLRQIDKPFIFTEWQNALSTGKEPFGTYLRMISGLHQYKNLTYDGSIDGEVSVLQYKVQNEIDLNEEPEIRRKWGLAFSNREYYELEKTWHDMIAANNISTPQHRAELEMYCKLKTLVSRALEANNIKEFEMLNRQFTEVKKTSGFRPIDKISSNESSGIRNFGSIFEEVERDGFIPPANLSENEDIVDKTILYILNYTRKLLSVGQMTETDEDSPEGEEDGNTEEL
jgi:hypothetical protein